MLERFMIECTRKETNREVTPEDSLEESSPILKAVSFYSQREQLSRVVEEHVLLSKGKKQGRKPSSNEAQRIAIHQNIHLSQEDITAHS